MTLTWGTERTARMKTWQFRSSSVAEESFLLDGQWEERSVASFSVAIV